MEKYKLLALIIVILYAILLAISVIYASYVPGEDIEKPVIKPGEGNVTLEFYYSSEHCETCEEVKPLIEDIEELYADNLTVERYPVHITTHVENYNKWRDYGFSTYPSVIIINSSVNKSFENYQIYGTILDTDEASKPEKFEYRVVPLTYENLIIEIDYHLNGNYSEAPSETKNETVISTPLGDIDYSEISLPVATILLGLADSVNPCSFFVLLFLLSLLLHTRSRKRMLLVGGIFIFFSGFIYFWIMVVIFTTTGIIEQQIIIALIAGIIATVFGILNIKDFFFSKTGPSASIPEGQKSKLFGQMRKIIKISSIPSLIIATVILAITANTVELFCSLGLPLIYTGTILPLFALDGFQNYFYIFIYNIVYIIPLLIIVGIVVFTLGRWKLSEFQGQILKLFSGVMILSLGEILLINMQMLENFFIMIFVLLFSMIITFIVSMLWKQGMKNQVSP